LDFRKVKFLNLYFCRVQNNLGGNSRQIKSLRSKKAILDSRFFKINTTDDNNTHISRLSTERSLIAGPKPKNWKVVNIKALKI
jgi:hypothetical protein